MSKIKWLKNIDFKIKSDVIQMMEIDAICSTVKLNYLKYLMLFLVTVHELILINYIFEFIHCIFILNLKFESLNLLFFNLIFKLYFFQLLLYFYTCKLYLAIKLFFTLGHCFSLFIQITSVSDALLSNYILLL